MFRQRHELDMRVIHILDVSDELVCKGAVIEEFFFVPLPRTGVHFVNQHGVRVRRLTLLAVLPFAVLPIVIFKLVKTRGGVRTSFGIKTVRIRFEDIRPADLRLDRVFVVIADFEAFDKNFPRLSVLQANHTIDAMIPVVEIPDNADRFVRYLYTDGRFVGDRRLYPYAVGGKVERDIV